MAVSHYFNNFSGTIINEQLLLEDLVVESIQIHGHDCRYMPREAFDSTDSLFGETPASKFSRAYNIEMYLANVEGWEGDGDFFSKFGLEIRDSSNFILSRRAFERYVPSNIARRPREGDLVYVPVLNKIFEIKFVEEELMFFSLGRREPYIYELRCEVFRWSQENIDTGIEDIDLVERLNAYTIELTLGTGSGNYIIGENVFQGATYAAATTIAKVKDWDPTTKILEVININGTFTAATQVRGQQSNTAYMLTSDEDMEDLASNDQYDNKILQTEADAIIVTTETNPFGRP